MRSVTIPRRAGITSDERTRDRNQVDEGIKLDFKIFMTEKIDYVILCSNDKQLKIVSTYLFIVSPSFIYR